MSKKQELNKRLAILLGWSNIIEVPKESLLGTPPPPQVAERNQCLVPDWVGNWNDCGDMMVSQMQGAGVEDMRDDFFVFGTSPEALANNVRAGMVVAIIEDLEAKKHAEAYNARTEQK